MQVKTVSIDQIKPYENSSRNNDQINRVTQKSSLLFCVKDSDVAE